MHGFAVVNLQPGCKGSLMLRTFDTYGTLSMGDEQTHRPAGLAESATAITQISASGMHRSLVCSSPCRMALLHRQVSVQGSIALVGVCSERHPRCAAQRQRAFISLHSNQ